jgi:2-amino-4-hydroxy-6-hydroxymethyldihydropteridine diphosphokinase
MSEQRTRAFIGVGANLGDARAAVDAAFEALAKLPRTSLHASSSIYRTAPIDSSGPDYLNAVVALDTELSAPDLLIELQRIELAHGRERPYRNAPRTLDLDLLTYGNASIDTPTLTVPHPRMQERAFVLAPLAEVAPDLVIPGHGRTTDLLMRIADQRIDKL